MLALYNYILSLFNRNKQPVAYMKYDAIANAWRVWLRPYPHAEESLMIDVYFYDNFANEMDCYELARKRVNELNRNRDFWRKIYGR